jgi:hypothetical protein
MLLAYSIIGISNLRLAFRHKQRVKPTRRVLDEQEMNT